MILESQSYSVLAANDEDQADKAVETPDVPPEIESSPEPETSDPLIAIRYNGILSRRLIWNESGLKKLAKSVDLIGRITLVDGKKKAKNSTSGIGDTLVLTQTNQISDSTFKHSEFFDVEFNPDIASIRIQIHDQVINTAVEDYLRTHPNADYNAVFVKYLRQGVNSALAESIQLEKMYQLYYSLRICLFLGIIFTTLGSIAAVSGIIGFKILLDAAGVFSHAASQDHFAFIPITGLGAIFFTISSVSAIAGIKLARNFIEDLCEIPEISEYLISLAHFVPPKHGIDYLKGALATQTHHFVALKPKG